MDGAECESTRKKWGREERGRTYDKKKGGGGKMSETKREGIALNAVDVSELNHRRPAVSSDSTVPLNITGSKMD